MKNAIILILLVMIPIVSGADITNTEQPWIETGINKEFVAISPSVVTLDTTSDTSSVTGFSNKGFNPNNPYSGGKDIGAINLYSGTLSKLESDIALVGRSGMSIGVNRIYNSNIYEKTVFGGLSQNYNPTISLSQGYLNKPGPFGYGWNGWHYGRILSPQYYLCDVNTGVNEWALETPDGNKLPFILDYDNQYEGEYRLSDGSRIEIIRPGTEDDRGLETIVRITPDGVKYIYNHHVYPPVGYVPALENMHAYPFSDEPTIKFDACINEHYTFEPSPTNTNVPRLRDPAEDHERWYHECVDECISGLRSKEECIPQIAKEIMCISEDPVSAQRDLLWDTRIEAGEINKYTDLYYGVRDRPDTTLFGNNLVFDSHLSGIYLTRIEDSMGNYVEIKYDDTKNRILPANSNGVRLGYGLSWGSPFVSKVVDTMDRTLEFEYDNDPVEEIWQKKITSIKYKNVNGEIQKIKYTYDGPDTTPNNDLFEACARGAVGNLADINFNQGEFISDSDGSGRVELIQDPIFGDSYNLIGSTGDVWQSEIIEKPSQEYGWSEILFTGNNFRGAEFSYGLSYTGTGFTFTDYQEITGIQKLPSGLDANYMIIRIKFNQDDTRILYGQATSVSGGGSSLEYELGICEPNGFLRKVEVLDENDELLIPATEYFYDGDTAELVKVKFGTGGEVEYDYHSRSAYWLENGDTEQQIPRRVVGKVSVIESPGSEPKVTRYYYDVGGMNSQQSPFDIDYQDGRIFSTFVVHTPNKDGLGGVERSDHLSPDPTGAYQPVKDFLTGLEFRKRVYDVQYTGSETTGYNTPIQYSEYANGEQPLPFAYVTGADISNDIILDQVKHFTTLEMGRHEFITRYLGLEIGNKEFYPWQRLPDSRYVFYKTMLQGVKTINYGETGEPKTSYTYYKYDKFGNQKEVRDYGYVDEASKGSDSRELILDNPELCRSTSIEGVEGGESGPITSFCDFRGDIVALEDVDPVGNLLFQDNTQAGPQEFKKTEITYLHEVNPEYLGKETNDVHAIQCSDASNCDPLYPYRNVLYQKINLPSEIKVYDINGVLLRHTKNTYDLYNPENVGGTEGGFYDTTTVANHRAPPFQQGFTIDALGACNSINGMLNKVETLYDPQGENRWITETINKYDATGNVREVELQNGQKIFFGFDTAANAANIQTNPCSLFNPSINAPFGDVYNKINGDVLASVPGNEYFKAYNTELKTANFVKSVDYEFNTGKVLSETIEAPNAEKTQYVEYDELGRVKKFYKDTDVSPSQIVEYYDFSEPQRTKLSAKLDELRIVLVDNSQNNPQYENMQDYLTDLSIQFEEISVSELSSTDFSTFNLIVWMGDSSDFYLEAKNSASLLSYLENYGKIIFMSAKIYDTYKEIEKVVTHVDNVDWDPFNGDIMGGIDLSGLADPNGYELLAGEDSIITGYTVDKWHLATLEFLQNAEYLEGFSTHNQYEILGFDYDEYYGAPVHVSIAIASEDYQITLSSLSPRMLEPEHREEFLTSLFLANPKVTPYASPINTYYDNLGRNYLSVQEDVDGEFIISTKEYDRFDGSVSKEIKPIKVSNYFDDGTCESSSPNAVECYMYGNIPALDTDAGIEYTKNGLGMVKEIASFGTSLGVEGDIPITYTYGSDYVDQTDKEGKLLKTYVDGVGNSIKEEIYDPESSVATKEVLREYNSLGTPEKVSVINYDGLGSNRDISFVYDNKNRLKLVTTPDSGITNKFYDDMNNEIEVRNAEGQSLRKTEFDSLNRVRTIEIDGQDNPITFLYDDESYGFGSIQAITDNVGDWDFQYDIEGRLIQETFTPKSELCIEYGVGSSEICDPLTFTIEYFSDGSVKKVSDGYYEVVNVRDALGRVDKVYVMYGDQILDVINNMDYSASGAVSNIEYGNGVTEEYTYYQREIDLLASQKILDKFGNSIFERGYTYTPSLNLYAEYYDENKNSLLATYGYDSLNQLTEVNEDSGSDYYGKNFIYDYDALGNIKSVTTMAGADTDVDTYLYDNGNSQLTETNNFIFEYDNAGRMTAKNVKPKVVPSSIGWNEYSEQGNAVFDYPGTKVSSSSPDLAYLSYTYPVSAGKRYKVTADIDYDVAGSAMFYSACVDSEGALITEDCGLSYAMDSAYAGKGKISSTFYVEATHPSINGVQLQLRCQLGDALSPATGRISCSNVVVKELDQEYVYDAQNMLTQVLFEDGTCLLYDYDYQNRRTFVADGANNLLTRYVYRGSDLYAELEDVADITCPNAIEEPIITPPPQKPIRKPTKRDVTLG